MYSNLKTGSTAPVVDFAHIKDWFNTLKTNLALNIKKLIRQVYADMLISMSVTQGSHSTGSFGSYK